MKKATSILVLLLLFCLNTTAQGIDYPCYFVSTKGEVFKADSIRLELPLTRKPYFLVDGKRQFSLYEWVAYQNNDGYFHKYIDAKLSYPVWYRREEAGKINLYSRFLMDKSAATTSATLEESDLYKPYIYTNQKIFYSQVKEASPQKLTYGSLTKLLESNAESLILVKKGQQLARIKTTLIASGVAILLMGGVKTFKNIEQKNGELTVKLSPLVPVGFVIALFPIVMKSPENRYQEAIRLFNNQSK